MHGVFTKTIASHFHIEYCFKWYADSAWLNQFLRMHTHTHTQTHTCKVILQKKHRGQFIKITHLTHTHTHTYTHTHTHTLAKSYYRKNTEASLLKSPILICRSVQQWNQKIFTVNHKVYEFILHTGIDTGVETQLLWCVSHIAGCWQSFSVSTTGCRILRKHFDSSQVWKVDKIGSILSQTSLSFHHLHDSNRDYFNLRQRPWVKIVS